MRSERGSLSLELTLLVPVLLLVLGFIMGAATIGRARSDLDDAAWEAARAASLTRSGVDADAAARQAVDQRLVGERWSCGNKNMDVDVSRFEPGGMVAVEINCDVRLASAGLFVPGATHLHSRVAAPLDRYRALR
ncbi:MAG TPA: TadE/TadG family type IV pilus assembly protein [Acidimicrobiia bacterium]|nr:TadE/TadG family type IV pilus assembly protein [Acidimicrobiia bacterium]